VLTRGWRSSLRREADDIRMDMTETLPSGEVWMLKCAACADQNEMLILMRYFVFRRKIIRMKKLLCSSPASICVWFSAQNSDYSEPACAARDMLSM
jgi:hypothetical protein